MPQSLPWLAPSEFAAQGPSQAQQPGAEKHQTAGFGSVNHFGFEGRRIIRGVPILSLRIESVDSKFYVVYSV